MPIKSVYPLWQADVLRTGRTVDSQAVSDEGLLWDSEKWRVGNWTAVGQWEMTCGLGFSGRRNASNGQSQWETGGCFRRSLSCWLVVGYRWRELPQVSFLSQQNTFFVSTKVCLSRQTYFCRDKTFVATNIYCDKRNFAYKTSLLMSRQTRVATKVLSRQAYFCRDKRRFFATNTCLSRQTKIFVSTKMIFVAAPANDSWSASGRQRISYLVLWMPLAKLRAHLGLTPIYLLIT